MCMQFLQLVLPYDVHFCVKWVSAETFADKLTLLLQYFSRSYKTDLSSHLVVPYICHLVGTFKHLLKERIIPQYLLKVFHKQYFAHCVLWLELLLFIPVNYAKCCNASLFRAIAGSLQWSSLQMFYASNFRHTCILPTPFMVFRYTLMNLRMEEVSVVFRKFRNFFTLTITIRAQLF